MNITKKLYNILDISPNSDLNTIKKSYRKLAFKYHPDRNNGKSTEKNFHQISEAYSVLSDPVKKKNYDQFGDEYLNSGVNFDDISPFKVFDNIFKNNPFFDNENMFCMTGNIEDDIKNFAKSFMNLRPLVVKVEFTLEQCYCGDTIEQEIDRNILINGRLKKKKEHIKIEIPKGVLDKERKIIKNRGNHDLNGKSGDLIIIFNELPHQVFERQGEHLRYEKKIILSEALYGVEFIFKTIYGANIVLKSKKDEIIDGNTYHSLEKFGLPMRHKEGEYGNLFIKYSIIFPEYLSSERKELLNKILPKRKPLPNYSEGLITKLLRKIDDKSVVMWENKKQPGLDSFLKNSLNGFVGSSLNIEVPGCIQM